MSVTGSGLLLDPNVSDWFKTTVPSKCQWLVQDICSTQMSVTASRLPVPPKLSLVGSGLLFHPDVSDWFKTTVFLVSDLAHGVRCVTRTTPDWEVAGEFHVVLRQVSHPRPGSAAIRQQLKTTTALSSVRR